MTAWIALVVASLLTLALRAGPSLINNGIAVPAAVQRSHRFAAPALMGALATRGIATQAAATGGIPVLAAVVLAVPLALRTRSIAVTVVAGTAAYLVAAAILR